MDKHIKLSVSILTLFFFTACGSSSSTEQTLKGGELLSEFSSSYLKSLIYSQGVDISDQKVYGYKAYKIPYVTKGKNNEDINVSGVFSVPSSLTTDEKEKGLSLVSYGHGTISLNSSAPSVSLSQSKQPTTAGVVFSALGGFATLEPDYVGYGDSSSHYHPYLIHEFMSNNSLDFITAVRKFAKNNDIELNEQLFVTGYSEGGYQSMSTVKKLEEKNIPVTASAPLAGGYDLDHAGKISLELISDEYVKSNRQLYILLTTFSYSNYYDKNISDMINSPYDKSIKNLLDGTRSFDEIESLLPRKLYGNDGLFKSDFYNDFKNNENNWLRKALVLNSVNDWSPNSPMQMVHCQGDNQTSYVSAKKTYENLLANGTNNLVFVTPDISRAMDDKLDHHECYIPSLRYALIYFKTLQVQ